MARFPILAESGHAPSPHHGDMGHEFVRSGVRGAGWGAGRDIEHTIFTALQGGPGVSVLIGLVAALGVALLVRRMMRRRPVPSPQSR
ncbi:MAG: hypothetical protein WAV90_11290 [Gordonia amarae]